MGNKRMLVSGITILVMIALTGPVFAGASGGNARAYIVPPAGLKGLLVYNHYSTADETYLNGEKNPAFQDFNVDQKSLFIRPVYYFKVGSRVSTLQALVPLVDASLDATLKTSGGPVSLSANRSGLADPIILTALSLINDPQSKTWLVVTEWFNLPIGAYDNKNLLNLGDNRWGFKTELGLVKGFGDFYIDLIPKIEFFTDNDDYKLGSSIVTAGKDPVYGIECHLSYDISKGKHPTSVSLDYNYLKGGKETAGGMDLYKEMNDHALQLSFTFGIAPKHKILVQYQKDLKVENGAKGSRFGIRYSYLFL